MGNDADAGMLVADACHLLRGEALAYGTIALPQDDARIAHRFRTVPAEFLVRVPDNHLLERNAHAIAGVAADVLVGKEEKFFAGFESPRQNRDAVGSGENGYVVV